MENLIPYPVLEAQAELFRWYSPRQCVDSFINTINVFANMGENDHVHFYSVHLSAYRMIEHETDPAAFDQMDVDTHPEFVNALNSIYLQYSAPEVTDLIISSISHLSEVATSPDFSDVFGVDPKTEALQLIEVLSKVLTVSRKYEEEILNVCLNDESEEE